MLKNGRLSRFLLASVAFGLMGCVPSLHPLYTADTIIYDVALLGNWAESDSEGRWEFRQGGEKSYRLTVTDDSGEQGEFEVHLVQIGDARFLDLFPESPQLPGNEYYQMHLLPVHSFILVSQLQPTLQLALLQPTWLKRFLAENPQAVKHEIVDGDILFTASPHELQQFLLAHVKTEGAFTDPTELVRQ